MFIAVFFGPLVLSVESTASTTSSQSTRTEFQKEIGLCLPGLKKIDGLKNFDGLLDSISSQYLLITEQIIYREVQFEKEQQTKRLKLTRDRLDVFEVDAEGRLTAVKLENSSKSRGVSKQIGQILHRAKILSDWQKSRETREGSLTLEIVRKDRVLDQIMIENRSLKSKLDCNSLESSQICICHK